MSNFEVHCYQFVYIFSCIFEVLLIVILNKLVNSYIFPLDKTVMHRLTLSILFSTQDIHPRR